MTLYIGMDFHPHQQTLSYCNTYSTEIEQATLFHNPELVHSFQEQMPKAVVGIEASSIAQWFENLMNNLTRTSGRQSNSYQSPPTFAS